MLCSRWPRQVPTPWPPWTAKVADSTARIEERLSAVDREAMLTSLRKLAPPGSSPSKASDKSIIRAADRALELARAHKELSREEKLLAALDHEASGRQWSQQPRRSISTYGFSAPRV